MGSKKLVLNICVVNDFFSLDIAGGHYAIQDLAQGFLENKHNVTFVCPYFATDSFDFNFAFPTYLQKYYSPSYVAKIYLENSFGIFKRLLALRKKFDIIVIQLPMPCAKGFNVFYGKLTGAKVAVDFGDLWFDIRHSSKNLLRTIHDRIVSLFCKYSDVVSVRDARMKNLLEEILGRSVIVVPQSVDTLNLFNPNKIDTEQAAELLPHDFQERKIVLYAGTVSREKGCQHIVPLAKDVVFRYDLTNVGFMIVGDGNYLSEMRRETARWGLSEYFHFVGRVPRSLLPVYISLATVTLSLQSHYPAKAIYYMAMGKPVIAVNGHSGTSEIVKHGKTGLIVQLDDLSEKLALLLADSDIAQHMGEQAREDACNNFDCKVIASNYLKLME